MHIPQKTKADSKGKFELDLDLIKKNTESARMEQFRENDYDQNILISEDNQPISPINHHHKQDLNIDKYFLDSSFATVQSSNKLSSYRRPNDFRRMNT